MKVSSVFTKHNPEIGARPGTLAIPPGSPRPRIHLVQYDAESIERRSDVDPAELAGALSDPRVTWVDIQGLGDEAVLRAVAASFELHPIALENAVNVPQRAKSELYDRYELVIARTPLLNDEGNLDVPQVCMILGERFLLTFQERYFGFFDPVRERLVAGLGPMRRQGPDYLAYALIDAMVDRYYPVAQELSDRLVDLEEFIVDNPHPAILAEIHSVRRQLVVLRRVGWPQREAISGMLRERSPFWSQEVGVFLRDTQAHIAQIVELIDSSREMASDLAESYLSNVSHRSNEIMKVLTLMASVFIPLTFVAGVYGMNFENMPELHSRSGYFVVLGVMTVLGLGMVGYFRHRGWIGGRTPPGLGKDDRRQDAR